MALFGDKRRQLTDQESDLLFDELTENRLLRARYASAFLSTFGRDLAETLPRVATAGIEVHLRDTGTNSGIDPVKVGAIAALACTIVACSKFRALGEGHDLSIGPDAARAVLLVIVVCAEIAKDVDAETTAHVVEGIEGQLGDSSNYLTLHRVAAQRAWEEMRANTVGKYNAGEIDDDEFFQAALELLENPPPWAND